MVKRVITCIKYPVLIAVIVLCLLVVAQAATGNIDATNKWAWGTNVGWINFNPTHGGGVTVYSDHLEGYAWGENIGWIRLGTYTGGGSHTYANDAANTYGVNNSSGTLSGYAWGTNVGWIKFNPTHGGVTINSSTGKFDGYAWGENIGWIHFKGPGYGVAEYRYVPVGGIVVPVNKVGLLVPWMGVVGLAAVGGVLLLRARRRR